MKSTDHRILMVARGSPGLGHVMPLRRVWKDILTEKPAYQVVFATYGSGAAFLRSCGEKYLTIPEPVAIHGYSFESGECIDKLCPIINKVRPHIIIGAGEPALGFLGEMCDIPVVLVVNPIDLLLEGPNKNLVLARHTAYNRCATIVMPSWPDERNLPKHGLPVRWIDLIPSDPITEISDSSILRQSLGFPTTARIIICSPGGGSGSANSLLHKHSLALVHSLRDAISELNDDLFGVVVASGDFTLDNADIKPMHVVNNVPSLLHLFAAADVAVVRAGRQTIFELMALSKPTLAVVPEDPSL